MISRSFSNCLRTLLILSLLLLSITPWRAVSAAATFTVNSNADTPDQNIGDGLCDDGGSACTLRAAIEESNALSGADTILFADHYTINIQAALPALTDTAGTTIRAGLKLITLDGAIAGNAIGLTIGSNNKIQGLTISNFASDGIRITGNNNIVGMDSDGSNDAQEFNQIYSNGGNGITVTGLNNKISGNYIGQNVYGTSKPNNHNGIEVAGASYTLIGTNGDGVSDSIEANNISYNSQNGIFDHGPYTIIAGNNLLNNGQDGLLISLAGAGLVGTNGDGVSDLFEGNRISGNHINGIKVFDSDNVTIAGNYIGVNAAGTAVHFNYDYGIYLESSNSTMIGTDGQGVGAANEGNLISGNMDGQIYALYTMNTVIAGNKIGTNITGSASIPSAQGFGIRLENADSMPTSISRIGTNGDGTGDALEGNLISGNKSDGIQIKSSDSNTIRGNIIGLNNSGALALPNEGSGISLINTSSQNNIIQNSISGNGVNGIQIILSNNNRVRGNMIGTDQAGTTPVPNLLNGVLIQNSRLNIIGTNSTGSIADPESNLISANGANGVKIEATSSNTDSNGVYGNRIGTDINGTVPLPNSTYGVLLAAGSMVFANNVQANLIAYHPSYAVRLDGDLTNTGNTIIRNSMISNYGGISINGAGANDHLDADGGPNTRQNYPVLTMAEQDGNIIGISLNLHSSPSTNFNLHFYLTSTCYEYQDDSNQGGYYLGEFPVATDASGNYSSGASLTLPAGYVGKGHLLIATATNSVGSTSEFSACIWIDSFYRDAFLPIILK